MSGLVLSLFPGIGLLDGGPPCQAFSQLRFIVQANSYQTKPNLVPEFERVIAEAQPAWFLMENVKAAPVPMVPGYCVSEQMLRDVWVGGETNRYRRFSFGSKDWRGHFGQRLGEGASGLYKVVEPH